MAETVPAGIHVRFVDDIAVLWLNDGENRLNINSVRAMNAALDQVESNESTKALIITGVGKYFSCGLDLDWLSKQDTTTVTTFFELFDTFMDRVLVYPMPTVAALNGHAYAAGGFLAMACDYRIMRTQRGWFCFPEINIKMAIQPSIANMIRMKIRDNIVFRDMVMYGQRVTGEEAKEKGVVDECVDMKDLMNTAIAFTKQRIGAAGFDRTIVYQMKHNLYGINIEKKPRDIAAAADGKGRMQERFKHAHKARL
ncbi:enoyl-CoA delta isomerase 2, peroxisomal-like [Acanthaster planci]|uniref:Enoyl-CoA delta isomerase 2, peroxisomal-like n=1 Tax=Acanthaster planci TaxID=133434 RepID=A0A8B7XQD8_ACAPL|nr:enoyl-CoA delta isomerase 2, peroxisomal-like [Acanthaster planci]XP_022082220.1 enoyl-CoA delta isomerase 2, peroxisomal-like [Acanthaster planci]